MKLVAAAKVRRVQEAVVSGRPFSETLVEALYNINEQMQTDDIDVPLTKVRSVKKIALVVVTGDRGLCGGFNNAIIKKAESRIAELKTLGLDYTVISVGKKGNSYFLRRPYILVDRFLEGGALPTKKEAQEGFETTSKEAASVYISQEEEQTEPDPHMLSAEENINLTQNLMGHNRRGRYPRHGVGASLGVSIRSSTASSTPSTSHRVATSSFQAMPFVARISAFLIDKIDPELHIQVTNEMTRVALTANLMDDLMGYVIQYLGGAIPHSAYGGVIRIISSIGDNSGARQSSAQSGDIGGSSTRSHNRDRDTPTDDDG